MNKKQIVLLILIIIWMATVFYFSAQEAEESTNTSGKAIRIVVDTLPSTKKLEINKKNKIVNDMQMIVRKLAHYSIYTLGGILIYCFINTFEMQKKNKIIYSILAGFVYSITDEVHQYFVLGRSCEFRDVCIDTLGIITGIFIVIAIRKIVDTIANNGKKVN